MTNEEKENYQALRKELYEINLKISESDKRLEPDRELLKRKAEIKRSMTKLLLAIRMEENSQERGMKK
ncbi:MAG: hypothetical protein WC343_01825 [Bacilli bacterium]|jgi:hypothetical protein